MDILIKGMEMPQEMECVEILLFSNGHCSFRKHERDEWVEAWAVALQEHGRLIDATELEASDAILIGEDAWNMVHNAPTVLEANNGADN